MTPAVQIACPSCGADLAPQLSLHAVFDTLEEARAGVGSDTKPGVVCAQCGKQAAVDAPQLLHIHDLALPLIFVAARGTSDAEDRAHLAALLSVAKLASGDEWRDEWTQRMWMVLRDQLAALLSSPRLRRHDVPNGLAQALDQLSDASDWSAVIAILKATPLLLTDAADALLAEYLEVATVRGAEVRDVTADRDLLRRVRAHGIDAIADAHLAREPDGLATEFSQLTAMAAALDTTADPALLDRFIALGQVVAAHPLLLGDSSRATRRAQHEQLVTACRAAAGDDGRVPAERSARLALGIAHQQQVVELAALCDLTEVVKAQNTLGNMHRELFQLASDDDALRLAIGVWRDVLALDPTLTLGGTKMAATNLGSALRTRFRRAGAVQDLHESVAIHERAVNATAREDALAHMRLNNLANAIITRFQFVGEVADIGRAIELWSAAVQLVPADQRRESATYLGHLASAYHMRFHVTGALEDLERSVDFQRGATQASDPSAEVHVYRLQSLGHVLMTRFGVSNDVQDLYAAIRLYEEALERTPQEAPERSAVVSDVASGLVMRFQHQDNVSDLRRAITLYREALAVLPAGHVDRDNLLMQFGLALTLAYERRREVAWLDEAIVVYREAAERAAPPSRSLTLRRLGDALRARSAEQPGRPGDAEEGRAALRAAIESGMGTSPSDAMRAAESLGDWRARDGAWVDAASAFATALTCADTMFDVQAERRTREALLGTLPTMAARAAFASARAGNAVEAALRLEGARSRLLLDDLEDERIGLHRLDALGRGDLRMRYHDAVTQLERAERGTAVPELESSSRESGAIAAGYAREERRNAIHAARSMLRTVRAEMHAIPDFAPVLAPLDQEQLLALALGGDAIVYVSVTPYGGIGVLVADGTADALTLDLDDATLQALMLRRQLWDDMTLEDRLAYGGDTVHYVQFGSAAAAVNAGAAALSAFRNDSQRDGFGTTGDRRPVIGGLLGAHLGVVALEAALDDTLAAIGQRIAGPVADAIRARRAAGTVIERVVVIASGLLSYVPFHAAPFSRDSVAVCLLDLVDVLYAPSARVFATARARRRQRATALTVVAEPRPEHHPLPLGGFEAGLIRSNFGAASCTVLEGDEASRDDVRTAVTGATHVHLATHGVFHPDAPLESSIELALGQQLTLEELMIARSFDGVQLVTFAACETALSDARFLPDEGLGLPSAAIRAGAACVIGALWSVREVPTALLMGRLYSALSNPQVAASRALREAQCWLRAVTVAELLPALEEHLVRVVRRAGSDESHDMISRLVVGMRAVPGDSRPFAHPQHWAAWIATGA